MTRRKQSGRLVKWVAAVVVLLALLAVFGPSPQYLASSSRAYPHPYIPLEPADVPLVISIEAGKRLIAGELGVDAVVFARYTFAWPPGFTGSGVVQAYLYREQVVAELIVTEHTDQTEIGRFVRARGSPGA